MLRWLTAGESHGPALVAVLEGLPAHVRVTSDDIAAALARRRLGFGRGARMKFEADAVTLLGGIRHGETQGGPVAIEIGNTEWPKWETVMAADPVDPAVLEGLARNAALTRPRPGHADLVGMQKYDFDEARPDPRAGQRPRDGGPGRAGPGGDELPRPGVRSHGAQPRRRTGHDRLVSAGPIPTLDDLPAIDADPVRCFDAETSAAMIAEVEAAQSDGDTLGGVVEVVVHGLPPGLGSHVHWDRRLDAQLAAALMGIQAIKGVEVGDGFALGAFPRERRPRRDRARVTRRHRPRLAPLGRHRGRDEHRRGAAGPGRHEADRHRAAGAAHRGRDDR